MTLEERANLTVGFGTQGTLCASVTGAVPRLNLKGLCLADAGQGLRNTDHVNAYPAGVSVGASWNRALTHQRGAHMAGEFKKKGVNVLLGPVIGGIGRVGRVVGTGKLSQMIVRIFSSLQMTILLMHLQRIFVASLDMIPLQAFKVLELSHL